MSPERRKEILVAEGIDPNEFDFDDEGNVFPQKRVDTPAPATSQITQPSRQEAPSLLGTAFRSFNEGIVPTVAGAGAAGAYLAGAPVTIPAAIGALAVGAGTSIATGGLQRKLVPQGIQDALFTRPEDDQNPISRLLGGIASGAVIANPATGLKNILATIPSLKNAVKNPVYANEALRPIDKVVLGNAAIGSGVGAGFNLYEQATDTRPGIQPLEVGLAAAGGALFNDPWKANPLNRITKMQEINPVLLYNKPVPRVDIPDIDRGPRLEFAGPGDDARKAAMIELIAKAPKAGSARRYVEADILDAPQALEQGPSTFDRTRLAVDPVTITSQERVKAIEDTIRPTGDDAITQKPLTAYEVALGKARDKIFYENWNKDVANKRVETDMAVSQAKHETEMAQLEADLQAESRAIERKALQNRLTKLRLVRQAQDAEAPNLNELGTKYSKTTNPVQEHRAGDVVQRVNEDGSVTPVKVLGKSKDGQTLVEVTAQDGTTTIEPLTQPTKPYASLVVPTAKPLGSRVTPDDRTLALQRGVRIDEQRTLPADVKGLAHQATRQIRINPDKATPDTVGHEFAHTFVDDLKVSARPHDRQLHTDLMEIAQATGTNPDEVTANALAMKDLDNKANSGFINWVKDIQEAYAYRYKGDKSKAQNVAAKRLRTDAEVPRDIAIEQEAITKYAKVHWNTPEFKRWFGFSEVKNADGTPKVFYHGTKAAQDFDEFNPTGIEPFSHFGTEAQANAFAKVRIFDSELAKPRMYPVYLSIENPLVVKDVFNASPADMLTFLASKDNRYPDAVRAAAIEVQDLYINKLPAKSAALKESNDFNRYIWERLVNRLKRLGYDGFKYLNNVEGNVGKLDNIAYVPFYNTQIKSATGNQGSYDTFNPNIKYSKTTDKNENIQTEAEGRNQEASPDVSGSSSDNSTSSSRGADSASIESHESSKAATAEEEVKYSRTSDNLSNQGQAQEGPRYIASRIDQIRNDKSIPDGPEVADTLETFYSKRDALKGKLLTTPLIELREKVGMRLRDLNVKEYLLGKSKKADEAYAYALAKKYGEPLPQVSPEQEAIADDLQRYTTEAGQERNARAGLHQGNLSDTHVFETISQEARQILADRPTSPEGMRFRNDYVQHWIAQDAIHNKKHNPTKAPGLALKDFNEYLISLQAGKGRNLAAQFGPADKAAGYGLPQSMREQNVFTAMQSFFDRYSRRLAFYDAFEVEPRINEMFFDPSKQNYASHQKIKPEIEEMYGTHPSGRDLTEAVSGLVGAAVTGTFSGVRDITNSTFLGAQHQGFLQTPAAILHGIKDLHKNWRESFDAGVNLLHIGALEGNDGIDGLSAATLLTRRIREIVNDVTGRSFLERIARAMAYSQGKFLLQDNLAALARGNMNAQQKKFMDDFAPSDWATAYANGITQEQAMEVAAKYAKSIAQTYDARDNPKFSTQSKVAPLFQLSRWSLGKATNFRKFAIEPALKGNFTPLLQQTLFAGIVGGASVEFLNYLLSGKESKTPTTSEIKALYERKDGEWIDAMTYRALTLATLGGYSGELGKLAKDAIDIYQGDSTIGYNILAVQATQIALDHAPALAKAIQKQDVEATLDVLDSWLEQQIQTYRVITRRLDSSKQVESKDMQESRDLKTFERYTGKSQSPSIVPKPSAEDYHQREWRRMDTKRLEAGVKPAELLQKAIDEIMESGKTPAEKMEAIKSLKRISSTKFPNIAEKPAEASDYYEWLKQTQGADAANKRLGESVQERTLRKAFQSMVP